MPPAGSLLAFFAAAVLLALSPGPDNLFVLAQSALYGRSAGLYITAGLATGLVVHTAAVALGVAALVLASDAAFTLLKLAGALYLLYLAWQAWHAGNDAGGEGTLTRLTPWQYYRRGILMNVSNPKVALFFLAFLPQFASPAYGALAWQIVLLGLLFMLAALLVFGAIALLAGRLGGWLAHTPVVREVLHRLTGLVLAGLAMTLLFTGR
jgi:threonine/homoserine/homoserine lactone efflux protein